MTKAITVFFLLWIGLELCNVEVAAVNDPENVGWICKSKLCTNCTFFEYLPFVQQDCPADASVYKNKTQCEMETGCGPVKWQCADSQNRKCSYCNENAGSKKPCNSNMKLFMTELDCEVGSDNCGRICKPDEVHTTCASCEPSCSDPTTSLCGPWTCHDGCACKPGLFRNETACVPASACPPITEKPCWNSVLETYKSNTAAIEGERWPYHQPFFLPECYEDGKFQEVQCSEEKQECFCVDVRTGDMRSDTAVKYDESTDCDNGGGGGKPPAPAPTGATGCDESAGCKPPAPAPNETIIGCDETAGCNPPAPPPSPLCPPNEEFSECFSVSCELSCKVPNPGACGEEGCISNCTCKQGYFRNDYLICVAGSECKAKTDCHRELFAAKVPTEDRIGRASVSVPNCALDGKYDVMQCHGSTGYCWCVDVETGTEIEGTRRGPTEENVECEEINNEIIANTQGN